MQGFVNREALSTTISSRKATFFSRSRSTLWTKGETSNNFINILDVYIDCDRDSVCLRGPQLWINTVLFFINSLVCIFSDYLPWNAWWTYLSHRGRNLLLHISFRSIKQWWGFPLWNFVFFYLFLWREMNWNMKEINYFLTASQASGNKLALTTLYSLESIISKRKEESTVPQEGKPSWTRRLLTDDALLCSKIRYFCRLSVIEF